MPVTPTRNLRRDAIGTPLGSVGLVVVVAVLAAVFPDKDDSRPLATAHGTMNQEQHDKAGPAPFPRPRPNAEETVQYRTWSVRHEADQYCGVIKDGDSPLCRGSLEAVKEEIDKFEKLIEETERRGNEAVADAERDVREKYATDRDALLRQAMGGFYASAVMEEQGLRQNGELSHVIHQRLVNRVLSDLSDPNKSLYTKVLNPADRQLVADAVIAALRRDWAKP